MNTDSNLKSDILSAYGTCDFIASLTGEDIRKKMEEELVRYVFVCSDSQEETEEFARRYLLDNSLKVKEIIENFSPAIFKVQGSRLMEDFIWSDEYFQTVNPKFPSLNRTLLTGILARILSLIHI